MSKTYYDLLELAPSAPVDEIKRAFRREIAKYHPDKVQHLGKEFQEIAAVRAAELTEAYKILSDDTLRAEYDEQLTSGAPAAAYAPAHRASHKRRAPMRGACCPALASPKSKFREVSRANLPECSGFGPQLGRRHRYGSETYCLI